ncbi:alpha/beta hydrolase [Paenarthrobacter sp. NPDC058040]|uniref:alpha/beta hydrolase n=1 Tax=unclassified Paenarthrobacter TaxID=2634190 RepID=UPI0036DAC029
MSRTRPVNTSAASATFVDRRVDGRDGAISIRDYLPVAVDSSARPFLWVHGGGFQSGGLDQPESHATALALASKGRWVRTVDYRLAPRRWPWSKVELTVRPGRYPAALHDVVDAALDLTRVTGAITIGGASAGACLAAGAVLYLRDHQEQLPLGAVLAYGTYHAELPANPALELELHGIGRLFFRSRMVRNMNLNYVGDSQLLLPGYAFPGGADLTGFPHTLLVDAMNDRLRASGQAFAAELSDAGVDTSHHVLPRSMHAFLSSPRSDHFATAVTMISDWLADTDSRQSSHPA